MARRRQIVYLLIEEVPGVLAPQVFICNHEAVVLLLIGRNLGKRKDI